MNTTIDLKLAKTTETTNAGKAVIVDSCGNLIFGTAGIDSDAVQTLIDSNISDLKTNIATNTTNVSNLQTCVSSLTTCTESLQTQITSNDTDISNINTCTSTLNICINCLKACPGLNCTGTLTSHCVCSVNGNTGNVTISCVNCASCDNCGHLINCNYCAASVSGSTLTLTRSNGATTTITLPIFGVTFTIV